MKTDLEQTECPTKDIEQSLIGAILLEPTQISQVAAIVREDDFAYEPARVMFGAMLRVAGDGKPLEMVIIRSELKISGEMAMVGGELGVADFLTASISGAYAPSLAREVARHSLERRTRSAIEKAFLAITGGEDATVASADLVAELADAESRGGGRREALTAAQVLDECLADDTPEMVVSTGYRSWDILHGGGIGSGSLTIIGAAPSIGKSQYALNLATKMKVGDRQARVLYVTMEMPKKDVICRLVSIYGDLIFATAKAMMQKRVNKRTIAEYGYKFEQGVAKVYDLPFRILDGHYTPDDLLRYAARYSGRFDVMIVDYLQLCGGDKNLKKMERVEAASKACKRIAMTHGAAVIAISNLNRDGYKDRNIKPDLANLKECGDIEFDADNVWTLWREKKDGQRVETLEAYIRKQRNGPIDRLDFEYDLAVGRIEESRPS